MTLGTPHYWLLKSEPSTWSWEDQKREGVTSWDGVRNAQATHNLKKMSVGDLAFFYHSGKEKKIVGIVRIIKPYFQDPSDQQGRFGMVDVAFQEELPHSLTLKQIKKDPRFHHLALVRQSRLSVMPIDPSSWILLNHLAQQEEV